MINLATPQEKKQIINILRSDYPESNWNEFSPFEIERTGVIITTKQQGAIIASFGRKLSRSLQKQGREGKVGRWIL